MRELQSTQDGLMTGMIARIRACVTFAGLLTLAACDDPQNAPSQTVVVPPPPAVTVVVIRRDEVPIVVEMPGRTSAFQTAEVRPQIGGLIQERMFTEGQEIKAGQQLYQIDPAPYQASLNSAEAALARAKAAVGLAESNANRARSLTRTRVISQRDLDTAEATLRQANADVRSAEASVEAARINLAYTRVLSPIDGRTGRSSVTVGALVTANQSAALLTITRLDPIYVDVTQPSARLLQQQRAIASGALRRDTADQAPARLILEDGSEYPRPGQLQFSEVIVDRGTGSFTLRAIFPNPEGTLMPGMFVRARVEEGVADRALLVRQQAVMRTPRGEASAFVVNAQGVVEARMLTTERAIGTNWLVTNGIQQGERVIVEGVQRVRPGSTVKATETTMQALNERNDNATQSARSRAGG
ncbi:efflux RND transporter periplasmic adaptor subunit [Sinorhizobium meliloti]|uniref:efflux RND transporter periplasmic adaptor subunit n=1 Tax=Rhizobium meliloti TaxID=382 RepID=UPI0002A59B61|nr:efflux RND transporter periplasmic adaptor subunit [Sinorhizobium meliloti]AGA09526.1 RND family efflux transporter, MFP subunit [Sinorhizobium meliloti GR4]